MGCVGVKEKTYQSENDQNNLKFEQGFVGFKKARLAFTREGLGMGRKKINRG